MSEDQPMIRPLLLFLNVFVIATCGLVYELLAGTLASYVLGDSVFQFSTCIGVYLFALGIGAWLSGWLKSSTARTFIEVELAVALLGGFSAPCLFLSFAYLKFFYVVLYGVVLGIGILVGLELPLLMRILKDELDFDHLVSRVLTFDYIGALGGALLFPMFLVPHLGLVRSSLAIGLLNGLVALWGTWILAPLLKQGLIGFLRFRAVLVLVILVIGFIKADRFTTLAEDTLYVNPVVYSETSAYQRIVITQEGKLFQLYLNGSLQFNSADEYRYHESLVHPAMMAHENPHRVLILGGGDGLALREVLKYPSVGSVTLVDLDPAMTSLYQNFPPLNELTDYAFESKSISLDVINQDAYIWIQSTQKEFDVVIIDFPDPHSYSLSKLYTRRFFRLLNKRLTGESKIGIQCCSPLFSRKAYWCIITTMEEAGFQVKPYSVSVPSFGIWGFAVSSLQPVEWKQPMPDSLRFFNRDVLETLFHIPPDLSRVPTEMNRLDNQILVQYYSESWTPPR